MKMAHQGLGVHGPSHTAHHSTRTADWHTRPLACICIKTLHDIHAHACRAHALRAGAPGRWRACGPSAPWLQRRPPWMRCPSSAWQPRGRAACRACHNSTPACTAQGQHAMRAIIQHLHAMRAIIQHLHAQHRGSMPCVP